MRVRSREKTKSQIPRNAAVPTEMSTTRTAKEIACWRVGHVT